MIPIPELRPDLHLSPDALARAFAALPPPPREVGTVTLMVSRDKAHNRTLPERVVLTPEGGMPGDRWRRSPRRKLAEQLAVQNHGVATLIANGQPLHLFGDNLTLDFDLSEQALPIGARVEIGACVVEVSPKAHTGCRKYAARFGKEALKFISAAQRRPLHLRGIYLQVIDAGEVWVGAEVRRLS